MASRILSTPTMEFPKYPDLPRELRLQIIGQALKPYTYKHTKENYRTRLAAFASIDFDWNQIIEQMLFKTISCEAEDVAEFGAICGKRYRHLREIKIRFIFSQIVGLRWGPGREEFVVRSLEQLFNIMKDWSCADRTHQDLIQLNVFIQGSFQDLFSSPPCDFSNFPFVQIIGGMSAIFADWTYSPLHYTAMHSLCRKLPNLHHASLALPFGGSLQRTIEDITSAIRPLHTTKPGLTELDFIATNGQDGIDILFGRGHWTTVSKCLTPLVSRWSETLVSLTLVCSIDMPYFLLVGSNATWPNIKELNLSGPLEYFADDAGRTKADKDNACSDLFEGLIASLQSMPKIETIRIVLQPLWPNYTSGFSLSIDLGTRVSPKEDFGLPQWPSGALPNAGAITPCADSFLPIPTSGIAQAVGIELPGHLVTELQDAVWLHRRLDLEVFCCHDASWIFVDQNTCCTRWNRRTCTWDKAFNNNMDEFIFEMGLYFNGTRELDETDDIANPW